MCLQKSKTICFSKFAFANQWSHSIGVKCFGINVRADRVSHLSIIHLPLAIIYHQSFLFLKQKGKQRSKGWEGSVWSPQEIPAVWKGWGDCLKMGEAGLTLSFPHPHLTLWLTSFTQLLFGHWNSHSWLEPTLATDAWQLRWGMTWEGDQDATVSVSTAISSLEPSAKTFRKNSALPNVYSALCTLLLTTDAPAMGPACLLPQIQRQ